MNKKIIGLFILMIITMSFFSFGVFAQEEEKNEAEFLGFELESILFMIGAWLSLFLFLITFAAYKRDGRKRLFFISLGFLLFALKNFMVSSELFIGEIEWFDPTAVVLEFAALLSFFFGVLKK